MIDECVKFMNDCGQMSCHRISGGKFDHSDDFFPTELTKRIDRFNLSSSWAQEKFVIKLPQMSISIDDIEDWKPLPKDHWN